MKCRALVINVGKTVGVPVAIRLTTRKPYERPIWRKNAWRVRKRDGYKCQGCGSQQASGSHNLDVHHVIPIRHGGGDEMTNLTTLCRPCHMRVENRMRREEAVL